MIGYVIACSFQQLQDHGDDEDNKNETMHGDDAEEQQLRSKCMNNDNKSMPSSAIPNIVCNADADTTTTNNNDD